MRAGSQALASRPCAGVLLPAAAGAAAARRRGRPDQVPHAHPHHTPPACRAIKKPFCCQVLLQRLARHAAAPGRLCRAALATKTLCLNRRYLLDAAARSRLFAHRLVCCLASEGTPPDEAFHPAVKRSGWKPPADSGLWATADAVRREARPSLLPGPGLADARACGWVSCSNTWPEQCVVVTVWSCPAQQDAV